MGEALSTEPRVEERAPVEGTAPPRGGDPGSGVEVPVLPGVDEIRAGVLVADVAPPAQGVQEDLLAEIGRGVEQVHLVRFSSLVRPSERWKVLVRSSSWSVGSRKSTPG